MNIRFEGRRKILKIKENIIKNFIITTFIFAFITLFFLIILVFFIPNSFEIPVVVLIGFALIIVSLFYFIPNLLTGEMRNKIAFNFKFLNENSIKIILMSTMIFALIFPPVFIFEDSSHSIMDWNQIGIFNYIRSIIFLIGLSFLPGACIYKILFPKDSLHKKFNVEPFLLKITIYPLLSFTFLGTATLILDSFRLVGDYITFYLFVMIMFLFFIDFFVQNRRNPKDSLFKYTKIKISKYTILILLISIGIVIITLGISITTEYLIRGDMWRGVSYANLVGRQDRLPNDKICLSFNTYTVYWGYVSFALGSLAGIPFINTNVMLTPFTYLFITSVYLFIKKILSELKELYAVLATIFVTLFSCYYWYYPQILYLSGIYTFSFRSFSFFSFFISLALFFSVAKTHKVDKVKSIFNKKDISILVLSSLLAIQCLITYYLPIIPGILLILLYCLFSKNKTHNFKILSIYFTFFIIIFLFFDLFSNFYFSWTVGFNIGLFLGLPPFSYSFLVYLFLITFLILILLIKKKKSISYFSDIRMRLRKIKKNRNYLFKVLILIFSIFLCIEIIFNFILIEVTFLTFYLDIIFLNLGLIGISGIYLSYLVFKKNRNLFYILISWSFSLLFIASVLIFLRWFQYPLENPTDIPYSEFLYMMYWFMRIWYFSLIPLSILSSIGIIKIVLYIRSKDWFKHRFAKVGTIKNLIPTSLLISLFLGNTVIGATHWYNLYDRVWFVTDEEAQIMGWVTENIPRGSPILVETKRFTALDYELIFCTSFTFITYYIIPTIDYLKENDIRYFIILKSSEEYFSVLLTDYFTEELYSYGNYKIYSNASI